MNITQTEISTQPDMWHRAVNLLGEVQASLPGTAGRAAFIGCGTSFYIGQAAAILRETRGLGESDALVASEGPWRRNYDMVVAISRSGTTTEVIEALSAMGGDCRTLVIAGEPNTPVLEVASDSIVLDFADEQSVVQTRFATTTLALLRAHFGEDLTPVIGDGRDALRSPAPPGIGSFEHFVFLGRGWSAALASEAALKFREAAGAWTESYPAMEYRHGPISVAGTHTLVWFMGGADPTLIRDIQTTGATVRVGEADPMAELVAIQRAAVELAQLRGLDPDQPTHLSRSVMLS